MDDSDASLPTSELLLAHSEFLASLSARLVTSGADADDLQQETWLSALRHPPADAGAMRAWLAKVVKNHALQVHRARSRRAAREQLVSREEGLPSTVEIVERENARRGVVEALTRLSEPYRSTLLLRFYEDLPPREVARRMNVPVETARTRIKRGLALVREDLDRRSDGGRSAWVSALLPLAAPRLEGGALAKGAATSSAAALGPLVLSLGILGALLAALGWVLWPVDEAPIRSAAAPAFEPAGAEGALESSNASKSLDALERRARTVARRVRVVHARSREPAVGFAASFAPADPALAALEWTSDRDGYAPGTLDLAPGDRFHVPASWTSRAAHIVVDEESLRAPELLLELAPASSVRGRVLDAAGEPAANARVWASPTREAWLDDGEPRAPLALANCDAAGEFTLLELPDDFYVHASAPGATAVRGLQFSADGPRAHSEVELRLEACWKLRGRVVDEDGRSLAGALLVTSTHDLRGPGRAASEPGSTWRNLLRGRFSAGANGEFELAGLAPIAHNLNVSLEGYAGESLRVTSPDDELVVVLQRARELDIALVDFAGAPVDGTVHLLSGVSGKHIRGAELGRVRFHVPRDEREVLLRTDTELYAPRIARIELGDGASHLETLVLETPSELRVRVVDETGEPVAGANLAARALEAGELKLAEAPREQLDEFRTLASASTGGDGRARLAPLPAGAVELVVVAQGRSDAAPFTLECGSEEQLVVVGSAPKREQRLLVRAADALSDARVLGCVLTARSASAEGQRNVVAKFDGESEVELPDGGSWILYLRAPGYAPLVTRWNSAKDAAEVQLRPAPERTLNVSARDLRGAPVHPARLLVFDEGGAPIATAISAGYWANYVELPESGELVLRGLPAARVRIAVRTALVEGLGDTLVDLTGEEAAQVRLELPCDLSSPRVRLEFDWPAEWLRTQPRWSAPNAPRRGAAAALLEIHDLSGALCGRFRLLGDSDGRGEFVQPWSVITLRFDADSVCEHAGLQRLDSDALSSDFGARWSGAGERVSVLAPAGGGRVTLKFAGREALAADYAPPHASGLALRPLAR
jgi:RNA polymerase sigma-70 factor (ECF subfamily)